MNATPAPARGPSRMTIGSIMLGVLLIALALAFFRQYPGGGFVDWRERVLVFHAAAIGLVVPIGVGLGYLAFAADQADALVRESRTRQVFAVGCVGWVAAFASLGFWMLMVVMAPD